MWLFESYFHCFKLICFYRIISKFIITLCNNSLIKFFKWISIWSTAGISFIICFKQSSFQFLTFSLHFLAKTWLYCWYDHLTFLIRHLSIGIVWDSSLLVRIWSSTTHSATKLSLCRFSTSFYWHWNSFYTRMAIGKREDKINYFWKTLELHIILKISHEEDIQSGIVSV